MKIICVEDDRDLAQLLEQALSKHNYTVDFASDGERGWNLVEAITYDLILLDILLPKLDGISFCKKLRAGNFSSLNGNKNTPVLLMTALDAITNKVQGLDAGADDYLIKPFDMEELLARIRALIRRSNEVRSPTLTWGKLSLNINQCQVTYEDRLIRLTAKEYEILELFLQNPQQIFNAQRLIDRLWKLDEFPSEAAIRTHIKSLRHKLKESGSEDPLETIYKLGYRLRQSQIDTESFSPEPSNEYLESQQMSGVNFAREMLELWDKFRDSYLQRVSILEKAVEHLKAGTLTATKKQEAEREAHTIVGSLGSFGLQEASSVSKQIQVLLRRETPLEKNDINTLEELVRALYRHLQEEKSTLYNDTTCCKNI